MLILLEPVACYHGCPLVYPLYTSLYEPSFQGQYFQGRYSYGIYLYIAGELSTGVKPFAHERDSLHSASVIYGMYLFSIRTYDTLAQRGEDSEFHICWGLFYYLCVHVRWKVRL